MSVFLSKLLKLATMFGQLSLVVAGLLFLGIYLYQGHLIYPASFNDGHGYCATPDEYGMEYEDVKLKTEDGETLHCYALKHDRNLKSYINKTVLILSPNAGNIGHALPIVALFYRTYGYNVFIYSYRGYGKLTGKPSEKGLKTDAERVIAYLTTEDEQFAESSLVLYGRSLGGAVAIYIAATMGQHVRALILENTFLSIPKTVPHIFPPLKYFTMFVHDTWELEKLVPQLSDTLPVLLFSARKDEIVPPSHMDQIYALLKTPRKTFHVYPDSVHNDTVVQPEYWDRVRAFIDDL